MIKIVNLISDIPLFNGLPEDQLHAIKQIAVEKKVNKGQAIFSEGDEGKGFFVVLEGRVKIYKVSAEGKEKILHIFGQGQPFGEVPVFDEILVVLRALQEKTNTPLGKIQANFSGNY